MNPYASHLLDIQTPALVLDLEALRRNIATMAAAAAGSNVRLRPHAKTHKSLDIARLQLEAGAVGICCATVDEIATFADANIPGLLLTTPVADRVKLERLAGIANRSDIGMVFDHGDQVTAFADAMNKSGRVVDALIDIDVGQARTGVCDIQSTVALARLIEKTPCLKFRGIQGFAGHVQHIENHDSRKAAATDVRTMLDMHREALVRDGIDVGIVTGSGTGAFSFDRGGSYTELQVGSYVFMDADYGKIDMGDSAPVFKPSLFVLATVTSVNRSDQFTVDAGVKALAHNGPAPEIIHGAPAGSAYRFAGDEHGVISLKPGAVAPPLGSRVLILTTHCDPTVNLHAHYHAVGKQGTVERWPVLGRYN